MTEVGLSPRALANMYAPSWAESGWEAVEQFLAVGEFADRNPGSDWRAAAVELDLPARRVEHWYKGRTPSVVKKIETADEFGWFDASWESPVGQAFNLVIAGVLSGGSLGKNYNVQITVDDSLDSETGNSLETAFEVLCGGVKLANQDDPQRATTLIPEQHNPLLGRAIHLLGIPTGRKTEANLELPEYLFESDNESVRREFVELYVLLRGSRRKEGTIDIREERSQRYLWTLASLIEEVTGESVALRENGIFLKRAAVNALSGTIVWDKDSQ